MAFQNSTLIHETSSSYGFAGTTTASEMSKYSPILARGPPQQRTSGVQAPSCNGTEAVVLTVDQTDEIPIWICGEPRFVSGITNHTTCNNIIEALIEDEILNLKVDKNDDVAVSRELHDYVITEKWIDVESPLSGDTFILPIWRAWGSKSATNEVKFKLKINKDKRPEPKREDATVVETTAEPQTGEPKTVGPKEESRKSERMHLINKMLRKILKQGETIKDHLSMLTERQQETRRIEKLCKKLRQTKTGKKILMEHFFNSAALTATPTMTSEDDLFYQDIPITDDSDSFRFVNHKSAGNKNEIKRKVDNVDEDDDDELFLVIENNDDLDSGVHFDVNKFPKQNMQELQPICSSIEMTEVFLETPKRKKRSHRDFEALKTYSLSAKLKAHSDESISIKSSILPGKIAIDPDFKQTSLQFDTIRREIIVKMNDLKSLLKREEELIVNLERKCLQYKMENEIYGQKLGVKLNVDKIQDNLNKYAKDIVQKELELYRTKLEIRESYLVLDDLRGMLHDKDPVSDFGHSEFNRILARNTTPMKHKSQLNPPSDVNSPFVDNIHEFCDNNNDSIIV